LSHRHAIGRKISIVLETISQIEIRIRISEETVESVVPLIPELFGEVEKRLLVDPIQSFESKMTAPHLAARVTAWLLAR
jgi:hypothetical protein